MIDKFIMNLAWHSCRKCPPKEECSNILYITNGKYCYRVIYECGKWREYETCMNIPDERLVGYWWADIKQAVKDETNFHPLRATLKNE